MSAYHCPGDSDGWIQPREPESTCPDYCPVFGAAAALCRPVMTIPYDKPGVVSFSCSYCFRLPMNRAKTELSVEEPGLYVIAYYIDANLQGFAGGEYDYSVKLNVRRRGCPADSPDDGRDINSDWTKAGMPDFTQYCDSLDPDGGLISNAYYAYAIRAKPLDRNDAIYLTILGDGGMCRVRSALLGAYRLIPKCCHAD